MRIFLDSSDLSQWQKFNDTGFMYGVTTNPLILQKDGKLPEDKTYVTLIDAAKDFGLSELQVQLTGLDKPENAVNRIKALHEKWPEGLVAKVPLSRTGISTLKLLPNEIPFTLTAAYETRQSVLAASVQAAYIAPYYGRMLEADQPADEIVDDMFNICHPTTRVLIASLRSAKQVSDLAARGHDTFTLSPAVFNEMLDCEVTEQATRAFEEAAQLA